MDKKDIPQFLRDYFQNGLERLISSFPKSEEEKFILFMEIQRNLDFHYVQHFHSTKKPSHPHEPDILRGGMNLATTHLLNRINKPFAIPIVKPTPEFRVGARNLLWNLGVLNLIRRTADMVQHGFLDASHDGESLLLRDSGTGAVQFMDHIQTDVWRKVESAMSTLETSPQGWAMVDFEHVDENLKTTGAFFSRSPKLPGPIYTREELQKLMLPLIRPFATPYGTLIGYEAIPEVDLHFIQEATVVARDFRDAAGIHPSTNFEDFTGEDLFLVMALLLSIYRKHVIFGLIACEHHPEIGATESFTIWGPKTDLIHSICELTSLSQKKVTSILARFTVTPEDISALAKESTPLLPMLVDLGNGFLLKPTSTLLRNPFLSFQTISQWRDPSTRNRISKSREEWFRSEIYALFAGARYSCTPGNVILRKKGKRLTDIDAAVFDRTNGHLALFQLKWQDYSTDDIRELRSKTSNLASEVDSWGKSVETWIHDTSPQEVAKAFRLKLHGLQQITAIFLFAVSRSVARTHGYGFPISNPFIAMSTWPQFRRVRAEIGPSPYVIPNMYEALRDEENLTLSGATPIPVTIELPGLKLHYENLWNELPDET